MNNINVLIAYVHDLAIAVFVHVLQIRKFEEEMSIKLANLAYTLI